MCPFCDRCRGGGSNELDMISAPKVFPGEWGLGRGCRSSCNVAWPVGSAVMIAQIALGV